MKKIYLIISLSLFIIILITSTLLSTYDKNFYIKQFKENNTYNNEMVKYRNVNPNIIADEVINYLKNDISDLNRNGYFTKEEIIHMKDVKILFTYAKYLIYLLLIIIITAIIYFKKYSNPLAFIKGVIKYFITLSIIIFTLLYIAFLNFSESFTAFHKLLFTNDYWLLDQDTSIIINIMPEEFFLSHTINIGKNFIFLSFGFILLLLIIYNLYKTNCRRTKKC